MSWLVDLWSALVSYGGQPVNQRVALNFEGNGVSVVDDTSKQRTRIIIPGTATTGVLPPPLSLTNGGATYTLQPLLPITTTDGTTALLGTVAIPAGGTTVVSVYAKGRIATAHKSFIYAAVSAYTIDRVGSAASVLRGSPFVSAGFAADPPFDDSTPGNPGSFDAVVSGNNLLLNAYGIGAPSAWSATTYAVGALVSKGGNVYIVESIAGTGTSTTGPAGTGQTVDNAGGNQVVWGWLAAGTSVPITWSIPKLETF